MRKPPPAAIPQTRLGRLARLGLAAGELAAGTVAEGLRRLGRGETGELGSALFSAPNARRLAARLGRLRGAAMKIGQLVSLQGEDVLPPEFAQALAVLRAQATPMPLQQLRGVLGREYRQRLGAPIRHVRIRASRSCFDRAGASRHDAGWP